MFLVAVDVGYSNLKVLSGPIGSPPATVVLPAGAGPAATMPEQFGRARDDRHLAVTVDGEAWAAGVEPSRLQNWERELHPDYPSTPAYRALVHAALIAAASPRVDRLVTGLPVSHYQDPARREQLITLLTGTHQVTQGREVAVRTVDILPQPYGAYLDLIGGAADAGFDQARVLVVDPGFFSVDWVLIDRGELRFANSGSSANAMSLLLEAADELIRQDHGGGLGRDESEKLVRAGIGRVNLFGSPVELAPYIAAAAKRTAAVAITALKQSMRSERRPIDAVLLAGGGAAVYAEAVQDAFPKARVIVPEDPVLANVRGFWAYAGEAGAEPEATSPEPADEVAPPATLEPDAPEPAADREPEAVEQEAEPEAVEPEAEPEAVEPPNPARARTPAAPVRPAASPARAASRAPVRGKRGKGG
jgi:plasmid segregation protein ParM